MYNAKSDHFSPKIKPCIMEIGNEMQYYRIGTNSELLYIDGSILYFIDFNFYQNYRQQYTVIHITAVRGPKLAIYFCHPGACQTAQKLVHFYMLITLKHKKVVEKFIEWTYVEWTYVVCAHWNCLHEANPMTSKIICY